MTPQEKLAAAVEWLKEYHAHTPLKQRRGMCLGTVRQALAHVGLRLPYHEYPRNTAWEAFQDLKADPQKWGFEQVHNPELPRFTLAFFGGCGYLKDGRMAGHIAILDRANGRLYADQDVKFTNWWAERLKAAFVPLS